MTEAFPFKEVPDGTRFSLKNVQLPICYLEIELLPNEL
jgi:hypothetical protein